MKSKIITLAAAFVLGVTAIAFSVRPSAAPSGKGSGKNTSISKPEELVEIISSLPSADEYYEMAESANSGKSAKGASAAADAVKNDIRSVSIYDSFSIENYNRTSRSYKQGEYTIYEENDKTANKMYQEAVAYFTAEAVYYNLKSTLISSESRYTRYYRDYGNYESGDSNETVSTVSTVIESEIYLGVQGAFFKFNKYEVIEETVKYENNAVVEEDESEKEDPARKEAIDAIRKNYGKWINAFYETDYDMDTPPDNLPNMTEDDLLNAMAEMVCAEVSAGLVEIIMNAVETDTRTLKKIAGIAALAGEKSNEYYDKSGKIYTMTPAGRFKMLYDFGYRPSENELDNATSSDGKINYNSFTPIKHSTFILDLSKGEKPAWYLDFDFSSYTSVSGYSLNTSTTMHEDFFVTNIDNTVAPKVSSSKTLYDLIGRQVKKVLKKEMEDR